MNTSLVKRLLEKFSYFLYYLKAMKFPFSHLTASITCNCGLHTISTAPSQVTGTCQRDWVNIILTACYLVSRSPSGETSNTDRFTYLHFNYSFSPAPPPQPKARMPLVVGLMFLIVLLYFPIESVFDICYIIYKDIYGLQSRID